jgi:uncharacterized membrane protein YeaQ/YmgE (transglycosylase-associated protein family)
MVINGFLATIGFGMLGAFFAELLRVAAAYRAHRPPDRQEWIASALLVVAGAGVILFGWDIQRTPWELAVLGAAFPSLFTAATRALTEHKPEPSAPPAFSIELATLARPQQPVAAPVPFVTNPQSMPERPFTTNPRPRRSMLDYLSGRMNADFETYKWDTPERLDQMPDFDIRHQVELEHEELRAYEHQD